MQFTERRDLLKARSALLALDWILRDQPLPGTQSLDIDGADLEEVEEPIVRAIDAVGTEAVLIFPLERR